MGKTIVVYKSNYGSTKKYANWIAEALKVNLHEITEVTKEVIEDCDTIIYGGGVYASRIIGLESLLKKYRDIRNKDFIVFAVGASPKSNETEKFIKEVLKKLELNNVKSFYLRGAIDEKNMTFIHRTMMKMMRKSLEKKDEAELEYWAKVLVDNKGKVADWMDKNNITELVNYINYNLKG